MEKSIDYFKELKEELETPHHILPDVGNKYTWYSNEIQGGVIWAQTIIM